MFLMYPGPEKEGKATPLRPANTLATCDVCGKQLARQSDMPRHKRLHDPKPDRWMHWCPEPGCNYGSMQRSNLRNHIRKHTGQRLHCPDDPTCPYSASDKSALLRHRQRKHAYQAKPTASKDRYMNASKNRISSSEKQDDPSDDDSSPTSPLEYVTESCCPCCSSMAFESSGQAYGPGAVDETDIWQDDDHAFPQATTDMTKQTVESIERSLVEGHVTSRFPVSFVRTRLPRVHDNGALPLSASKHCRCCCRTSNLQSTPEIVAQSNSTGENPVPRASTGMKVKEVVIYRRVGYLVQESASTVDRSRHNLSRTRGALNSYSRVST